VGCAWAAGSPRPLGDIRPVWDTHLKPSVPRRERNDRTTPQLGARCSRPCLPHSHSRPLPRIKRRLTGAAATRPTPVRLTTPPTAGMAAPAGGWGVAPYRTRNLNGRRPGRHAPGPLDGDGPFVHGRHRKVYVHLYGREQAEQRFRDAMTQTQ
jgi:hypothetical protein